MLALAPVAGARCTAPPGTAAVDQYCESVPGHANPSRPSNGPGSTVPLSTASALADVPGGASVLAGLDAGSGKGKRAGTKQPAVRKGERDSGTLPAPSDGAAGAVRAATGSLWSGELRGVTILLALTLLVAVALRPTRRRASPGQRD
jgi:hypothetical protein